MIAVGVLVFFCTFAFIALALAAAAADRDDVLR